MSGPAPGRHLKLYMEYKYISIEEMKPFESGDMSFRSSSNHPSRSDRAPETVD
jgi:hypothetical protein